MKKNHKNILLVSHDLSRSGAPVVLLWLAKFLKSMGYDVDVWSFADGDLYDDFVKTGITPTYVLNSKRAIHNQFINTDKHYDYIICNTILTYKAVDVLQRFGIPTIWYIHESGALEEIIKKNKDFKKVFENFYNIYTCSEYAAKICRKYNKVSKVRIIPNSVEDSFKLYTFHKNISYGYIGRISNLKGSDVLVSAFKEIVKDTKTAKLYLAGNNKSGFAKSLVEETKNIKQISWVGPVKDSSKRKFFDSIDVFILPSLYDSAPITLLEGLMYGKAIITTQNVGNCEFISEKNGFVINAGSKEELAKAMHWLQDNKSEIPGMMRHSRKQYLSGGTEKYQQKAVKNMLNENIGNVPVVRTKIKYEFLEKVSPTSKTREILLCGYKVFRYNKRHK